MRFASIPELLSSQAQDGALAQRTALESAAGAWSYRELDERVRRVAGELRTRGLQRGDRVGLLVERHLGAVAGLFGVMAAGGAVCPLEPRLAASDLALRLKSVGIEWVLADAAQAAKARELALPHTVELDEALSAASTTVPDLQPDDDALMLFTSGSTGVPKAVLLTHGNLLANAEGVAERTGVTLEDRLLHAMPLFHTNGVNNQLLVPFSRGATVSFIGRFRAETFFDEMRRWRPTYITGVPTMYSRLLAHTPPREALQGLRFARCGAAPLSQELHRSDRGASRRAARRVVRVVRGNLHVDDEPARRLPVRYRRHRARWPAGRHLAAWQRPAGRGRARRRDLHRRPGGDEGLPARAAGGRRPRACWRLAAHRRPRLRGCRRLPRDHRPPEGHHHPRWREPVAGADRMQHLRPTRRSGPAPWSGRRTRISARCRWPSSSCRQGIGSTSGR